QRHCPAFYVAAQSESQLYQNICLSRYDAVSSAAGGWPVNGAPPFSLPDAGDSTAVRLSAPGAVRHDVAHQVVHVVLQISDDVLDDVSDRDHPHALPRAHHWKMAKAPPTCAPSSTGRWRKPRAAIIAMQPSSRSSGLTVTGSPVITWPTGVCFASSPGSSTFMAQSPWVTIPTSTSSSMTSTDRTRLSRIWRKA